MKTFKEYLKEIKKTQGVRPSIVSVPGMQSKVGSQGGVTQPHRQKFTNVPTEPGEQRANALRSGERFGRPNIKSDKEFDPKFAEKNTTLLYVPKNKEDKVQDTGKSIVPKSEQQPEEKGQYVRTNKETSDNMQKMIGQFKAAGAPIGDIQGYNNRTMRTSKTASQHAMANALDLGNMSGRGKIDKSFSDWIDKNRETHDAILKRTGAVSGETFSNPDKGHYEIGKSDNPMRGVPKAYDTDTEMNYDKRGQGTGAEKIQGMSGTPGGISAPNPASFIRKKDVLMSESKSFKQFLNVKVLSIDEIAKKHKVTVNEVKAQLIKGIKVEKEHTKKEEVAKQIALAHLGEDIKYYEKLKQIEKKK